MKIEKNTKFIYKNSLKQPGNSFIERYFWIERFINRPIASLIVRAVYKTPVTPNGLTFISFFLGLASAVIFSLGNPYYFIWGGILIQLSSIVDCSDGMLARAKNMCSDYGSFLDLFLDRVTDFFLFAGIAMGMYRYTGSELILILGLMTAGMYVLQISLYYLTKTYLGIQSRGETGELRAFMLFGISILAIFNLLDIVIYLMVFETALNTMGRVIHIVLLGRKIKLAPQPEKVVEVIKN